MIPIWTDELDDRQQKELDFARTYAQSYHHGTDGHSRLMLIARLAELLDRQAARPPASLDDLVESARQAGAEGIWVVRGAQRVALLYAFDVHDVAPVLQVSPPHEVIVLLRFAAGDGGESGVEYR